MKNVALPTVFPSSKSASTARNHSVLNGSYTFNEVS